MISLNRSHIIFNFLGSIIPLLVTIASIPLTIQLVGVDKYGVLVLVWLVFGYFGLLDFGVARATTNAISKSVTEDERRTYVWAALHIAVLVGMFVSLVGIGAAFLIASLTTSQTLVFEALQAWPWLMAGIPIVMITATLGGALDGIEKFSQSNVVQIFGATGYQLAPLICAAYVSTDIKYLVASVILARAVAAIGYTVLGVKHFKLLQRYNFSLVHIKRLMSFGGSVAAINILDLIFGRLDQILVATKIGASAVAAYNVAMNSTVKLGMLPLAMSRSVFPQLSSQPYEMAARSAVDLQQRVLYPWTAACAVALLGASTAFNLWLPPAIAGETAPLAQVLICGLWINCLAVIPYTVLQAQGQSHRIIRLHFIEMPIYCGALLLLLQHYGARGAAYAFVGRNALDYLLLWKLLDREVPSHKKEGVFLIVLLGLSAGVQYQALGR